MEAIITVPHKILYEGTTEEVQPEGCAAQRRYLIEWKDRWQFAKDVAGTSQQVGDGVLGINRTVPLRYDGGNSNLFATGLSMQPLGIATCTTPPSYHKAIVTVTFSTLPFDVDGGDVYRSVTISMSTQIMTLPTSPFMFENGTNAKLNLNPGVMMPTMEIGITSHQVPKIPFDVLYSFIGSVNESPFYGAPIGQLLFTGVETSGQATSSGVQKRDVSYKFIFRGIEWNMFFSPVPGEGWDYIVDKNTGDRFYAYKDFTQLP